MQFVENPPTFEAQVADRASTMFSFSAVDTVNGYLTPVLQAGRVPQIMGSTRPVYNAEVYRISEYTYSTLPVANKVKK